MRIKPPNLVIIWSLSLSITWYTGIIGEVLGFSEDPACWAGGTVEPIKPTSCWRKESRTTASLIGGCQAFVWTYPSFHRTGFLKFSNFKMCRYQLPKFPRQHSGWGIVELISKHLKVGGLENHCPRDWIPLTVLSSTSRFFFIFHFFALTLIQNPPAWS